jgi:hypothetical protein
MKAVIVDPRGARAALAEPSSLSLELFRESKAERRLDVYAEGYFARLLESLSADFPATRKLLGENLFGKLVADYLKSFPSRSFTLAAAGASLAEFSTAHFLLEANPGLPDLIRLEWSVIESFYAAEEETLDPARLATLGETEWAEARLRFNPSVRLLFLKWNLIEAWKNRWNESESIVPAVPTPVLVFRRDGDVEVEALAPAEFRCLEALAAGACLADALQTVEDSDEESESEISVWFAGWMTKGLIRDFSFGKS